MTTETMTQSQIFLILSLVDKYGPSVINKIKLILAKKDATIDDVEAAFGDLKPYEAFNIPAVVPTIPQ